MKGKRAKHVQFVSTYRPNPSLGPNTVHEQHVQYFLEEQNIFDPKAIELFDWDLTAELERWIDMGDQVVLGIDANISVKYGPLVDTLRELSTTEAILGTHSSTSPPATYNRNTNNDTINGIFVTSGVGVKQAGLAVFDSKLSWDSNHRMAWIQLTASNVLGDYLPHTPCNDPRQRLRYQRRYQQQCDVHKVNQKIKQLRNLGDRFLNGEIELLPTIIDNYHTLHKTTDRLRRHAAKGL